MKAAVVRGPGQTPVYADFAEPVTSAGENRIRVAAAALSQVTKSRAAGRHYSSSGQFPFVAGIDGVGRLDDGKRVYFALPKAPHGSMAECTVVASTQCVPVPEALDDISAAAIANPGMSSWAAYVERAKLTPGESVLINGATGMSGRLAVQIAKHFGAGKIIATGRNVSVLNSLPALGADVIIPLGESEAALESHLDGEFAGGVNVVIDYLWGKSAESILKAAAKAGSAVRFVQVGAVSGSDITLSSAVLRSSPIELMGSGLGSVPFERFIQCVSELLQVTASSGFKIATKAVPLSDVESAWNATNSDQRTVFTLDAAKKNRE